MQQNKFVDIAKSTGHMSAKQMEYLRVYVVNYLAQLKSSLTNEDILTTYLDNQLIFKCILPFEALTNQYKDFLITLLSKKDVNGSIAQEMYLSTIKYQIYCQKEEHEQNAVFETNFRQVYSMKLNIFHKVVEIMPMQAQEMGFLEIR